MLKNIYTPVVQNKSKTPREPKNESKNTLVLFLFSD